MIKFTKLIILTFSWSIWRWRRGSHEISLICIVWIIILHWLLSLYLTILKLIHSLLYIWIKIISKVLNLLLLKILLLIKFVLIILVLKVYCLILIVLVIKLILWWLLLLVIEIRIHSLLLLIWYLWWIYIWFIIRPKINLFLRLKLFQKIFFII